MEICKAKVKANIGEQTQEDREMWKSVERIIDSRWTDMLQKPLHLATHYLNSQYYFATPTSGREMEANIVVKEGFLNCIEKLALDNADQQQILRDVVMYRQKKGRFGREMAQSCVQTYDPGEWWETFGSEVPALQRFARRVLCLTSSASPCERNWSTFNNIHTKKRNCLEHERLNSLAYVQYNMRLKKRYEDRMNGKDLDPIVLKNFVECVEWLIPRDAHDDIVLGTDGMTFGVLGEAGDGSNDPPTTRQSRRTNTTSQGEGSSRRQRSHFPIDEDSSSDEDENDGDEDYDGDGFEDDNDGISSGDDEDLP